MKSTSLCHSIWNPVGPFLLFCVVLLLAVPLEAAWASDDFEFRVMTWNIWHGGREDGEVEGPKRVAEVIERSQADIVAMQETYGSGEQIAAELEFEFHPRGTNVSIHSRFPIIEDISVFEEFKCVGAVVELPTGKRVALYSIWLPYAEEIWAEGTRDPDDVDSWVAACEPSAGDVTKILGLIEGRLKEAGLDDLPLIIAGDFNSMSHLDYTAVARDDYGAVVEWPTSVALTKKGLRDSFREVNPDIGRTADRTWSPRFPDQQQDRIDFIYFRGRHLSPTRSVVIDDHPVKFPSDHAAVVTTFRLQHKAQASAEALSLLSYNIRHGQGMDGNVDLNRTAKTIDRVSPDIVALQEVDLGCSRSASINQPRYLAQQLGMHAAFGQFMDFQGGRYGMAILSRYPIYRVEELALPEGNEPRIALVATVRLPDDSKIRIVNVHFDWVADDAFRYAQAKAVMAFLKQQDLPFVLLGDFNDRPGSRTIRLFRDRLMEAVKPESDPFTFPAGGANTEIDYVFASPHAEWAFGKVEVVTEPVTSDHRPVHAVLNRRE